MRQVRSCLIGVIVLLWSTSAFTQWIENGIPICTSSGIQEQPRIVNDGSGGSIVIWVDSRDGDRDLYAQRISGDGVVLWQEGGIAVCTADYDQWYPEVTADGAGGVIVTWQDFRMGYLIHHRYQYKIFAQRISSDGTMLWVSDGLPICTTRGNQQRPVVVSDGSGGAIITWLGRQSGKRGIYAQRIISSGMPVWQSQGMAVCAGEWTMAGSEYPDITSDSAGGAIITWRDYRNRTDWNVYAQRILATGTPRWTVNGIPVCSKPQNQLDPHIVHDSAGGAIIVWRDGDDEWDVFTQRVSADGSILWEENGVPVCTTEGDQYSARLVSDGAGGCIIAWRYWGNTYAQKITENGDAEWQSQGVPVYLLSLPQYGTQLVSDNTGGAIIAAYETFSNVRTPIIAQKLVTDGSPDWRIPVCMESGLREDVRLVFDGDEGAITVWRDHRDDEGDIYTMRIKGEIPPVEVSLDIRPCSCPNPLNPKSKGVLPVAIPGCGDLDVSTIEVGSIELEGVSPVRWSYEDVTAPVSSDDECACTEAGPDGIMDLTMKFSVPELVDNLEGLIAGHYVEITVSGTLTDGREIEGTDCVVIRGEKPCVHKENREMLAVSKDSRPDDPVQMISYHLPVKSDVRAAVYDVSGRLVKRFDSIRMDAGLNTLEWDTAGLPSGMYFCRIASGSYIETVKIVLLK